MAIPSLSQWREETSPPDSHVTAGAPCTKGEGPQAPGGSIQKAEALDNPCSLGLAPRLSTMPHCFGPHLPCAVIKFTAHTGLFSNPLPVSLDYFLFDNRHKLFTNPYRNSSQQKDPRGTPETGTVTHLDRPKIGQIMESE